MSKLLLLAVSAFATLLISKPASAHSDYWRCAAAAGSVQRAIAICGIRGPGGEVTGPIYRPYPPRGPYYPGPYNPGPRYPRRGRW